MCCKQPLHAFAWEFSEKGGERIRQRGLFALKCWCHANTAQRFSPNRTMWCSTSYDGQGFWLAQKRLSQGRFVWWPSGKEPSRVLQAHQAQLLLAAGNPDTEAAPVWRKVS